MIYFQVAAAIIRKDHRVLICQRSKDDEAALLWEFPGGKRKKGETLEACIIREIKEELNLDIKVLDKFMELDYRFMDRRAHFTFFEAEIIGGEMQLNVHDDMAWAPIHTLHEYEFLPADIDVIRKLQGHNHGRNSEEE
jgi:8-oxo-dGTP diphosphatase